MFAKCLVQILPETAFYICEYNAPTGERTGNFTSIYTCMSIDIFSINKQTLLLLLLIRRVHFWKLMPMGVNQ